MAVAPDLTIRTVTQKALSNALRTCIRVKQPAFIWGPPGCGKSDIVAAICKEMGGIAYDLRLSQLDPVDIRGTPFYNRDANKMCWAPPEDLPDEETASKYPIVFLFLDEMNAATQSVMAASYQLVLNRRIGTYHLPDNVVVIAAGNRDCDRSVTHKMPPALANRFTHFEIKVDFDCWEEWAVQKKIHKDVIGYLNWAKNDLYDFDPASPSKAFATPRSWEFVSRLLSDDTDENTQMDIVSGTVGHGLAAKFMQHRRIADKLPKPSEVIDGSVTTLDIKDIGAQYSLGVSLCYELDDLNKKLVGDERKLWHLACDNYMKYILDNFTTEVGIMSIRIAMKAYELPFDPARMKQFDSFYERYGKYVMTSMGGK